MGTELHPLTLGDLNALLSFYSGLSRTVTDTFEPFGPRVTEETLRRYLVDTDTGTHLSFGLFDPPGIIVGHVFIWNIDSKLPVFGIGLAERAQGRGWGRRMAQRVLEEADARGAKKVALTVVKTNVRALGFSQNGRCHVPE